MPLLSKTGTRKVGRDLHSVSPYTIHSYDTARHHLEEFKKKGLDKKFGENFNTAGLSGVRTIVACNGKFGNNIINADSTMMAYCPVRITMTEKDGKTTVLFVRPSAAPQDSKAYPLLVKLEKKVIGAIEGAMK